MIEHLLCCGLLLVALCGVYQLGEGRWPHPPLALGQPQGKSAPPLTQPSSAPQLVPGLPSSPAAKHGSTSPARRSGPCPPMSPSLRPRGRVTVAKVHGGSTDNEEGGNEVYRGHRPWTGSIVMAETPVEEVNRLRWPWSVVGALWVVLRCILSVASWRQRMIALSAWGSIWDRSGAPWRGGQAHRQSENPPWSNHPDLPLIKATLTQGGSCQITVGGQTRLLRHSPMVYGPPRKLLWPLSRRRPSIVHLRVNHGDRLVYEQRSYGPKQRDIQVAILRFLEGAEPQDAVLILPECNASQGAPAPACPLAAPEARDLP
jgi:hypothetical protein